MFWYFHVNPKWSFYLQDSDLLVCSEHKPLQKILTGSTDNEKGNTQGLEAAAIPRHIKLQHIKGIANILADSVSRLKAVGLHHNLDFPKSQQDLGTPFEPLPPIEQAMHSPIVVHEISVKNNVETLEKQVTPHKQITPTYP